MHATAREQLREVAGLREGVIHAIEQAILDRGDASAVRLITIRGLQHLLHIKTSAHRQQIGARGIVRRVQRDREMHAEVCFTQFMNARHDADGRNGDLSPTEGPELWISDALDGREDVFQIQHRLAHAHEDDGAQRAARCGGLAAQMTKLLDDFAGGEVALEARLRRRAEIAAHRTAHLARNTACGAIFAKIRHQDAFDRAAIVQPEEQFGRFIG